MPVGVILVVLDDLFGEVSQLVALRNRQSQKAGLGELPYILVGGIAGIFSARRNAVDDGERAFVAAPFRISRDVALAIDNVEHRTVAAYADRGCIPTRRYYELDFTSRLPAVV